MVSVLELSEVDNDLKVKNSQQTVFFNEFKSCKISSTITIQISKTVNRFVNLQGTSAGTNKNTKEKKIKNQFICIM